MEKYWLIPLKRLQTIVEKWLWEDFEVIVFSQTVFVRFFLYYIMEIYVHFFIALLSFNF